VLTPNSSIPSTASRAPINCQCSCSVSPDEPRVLIESAEKRKAPKGESRAPSHKDAVAQIPHSIPCTAANYSPTIATDYTNHDRDELPHIEAAGFQSEPYRHGHDTYHLQAAEIADALHVLLLWLLLTAMSNKPHS